MRSDPEYENDAYDHDCVGCEIRTPQGEVIWSGFSRWAATRKLHELTRKLGIELELYVQ